MYHYDPFKTKSISVSFQCPNCGSPVQRYNIRTPHPADALFKSQLYLFLDQVHAIQCNACNERFLVDFSTSHWSGIFHISNLPSDHPVKIIEDEDGDTEIEAIVSNTTFHRTFKDEIAKISELNESNFAPKESLVVVADGPLTDDELGCVLRKLLFAHSITCLESYLSSAFINTVLSDELHLKRFFENFKDFTAQKFELTQLFDLRMKTKDIAKAAIQDIIFHNLGKIKPIFKDCLGVTFPDIKALSIHVNTRHDIVHRNGRSKEGKEINISSEDVRTLILAIDAFVDEIDQQITALSTP